MKRCALVVGARPQFVKAAALLPALRARGETLLWHTGQHFDSELSALQFADLKLPRPDLHLEPVEGDRKEAIAASLAAAIESSGVDRVVVVGDTDSTVAGARAARRTGRILAHVEAGCRSGESDLPEERNRIEVDGLSDLLLCSTGADAAHLEGREGVHVVGDVMADLLLAREAEIRARAPRAAEPYAVLTLHRAATIDDPDAVARVVDAVAALGLRVVFPVHPRLKRTQFPAPIEPVRPMAYGDFLSLVAGAAVVLTDSGGLQKESYLLGVPCVTLREATEWGQTVEAGWNVLVGTDPARIRAAFDGDPPEAERRPLFGDGQAAQKIAALVWIYSLGSRA